MVVWRSTRLLLDGELLFADSVTLLVFNDDVIFCALFGPVERLNGCVTPRLWCLLSSCLRSNSLVSKTQGHRITSYTKHYEECVITHNNVPAVAERA